MSYQISTSIFSSIIMFSVQDKWVEILGERFESNLFNFDFSEDKILVLNYIKDNYFDIENGVYKSLVVGNFEYYMNDDNQIVTDFKIKSINNYKLLEEEKNDYLSQLEDYQLQLDLDDRLTSYVEEINILKNKVAQEHEHYLEIEKQRDESNQY